MFSRSVCGGNDGTERAPSGRKKAGLDLQADVLRLQCRTAGSDAAISSSQLQQMGVAGPEKGGGQRGNLVRRLQLGDSRHSRLGMARSGIAARFAHLLAAQLSTNLVSAMRNGRIEMRVRSCLAHRRRPTGCTSREARHQCQQENERVRKKMHSTSGFASQVRRRSGKDCRIWIRHNLLTAKPEPWVTEAATFLAATAKNFSRLYGRGAHNSPGQPTARSGSARVPASGALVRATWSYYARRSWYSSITRPAFPTKAPPSAGRQPLHLPQHHRGAIGTLATSVGRMGGVGSAAETGQWIGIGELEKNRVFSSCREDTPVACVSSRPIFRLDVHAIFLVSFPTRTRVGSCILRCSDRVAD